MTIYTSGYLRLAWMTAGLLMFTSQARSVCQTPQPRLVCAEYVNSQAVVIARLVGIREIMRNDGAYGHLYQLAVGRSLRGRIDSVFEIWEENSSGRSAFAWTKGTDYLLFASYSEKDHAWDIDGCGNSGPLNRSASTLAAIRSISTSAKYGIVEGMTSTESWTDPVPDVTIRAVGSGTTFTTSTDGDGRFKIRLPAGRYSVVATRTGWSFAPEPFSYEPPGKVDLTAGGCAQVQFAGAEDK